jgi:hypothetical protein
MMHASTTRALARQSASEQAATELQAREMARQAKQAAEQAKLYADAAQDRAAQAQSRDQLGDQIRDQVNKEVNAALQGARDGAAQSDVSVQSRGGGRKIITIPDGKGGLQRIEIGPRGVSIDGELIAGTNKPITIDASKAIPTGVVDIVQAVGATLVLTIVGLPLARAIGRWINRRGTQPTIPTEVMSRLSNIENAVDTVAVEVERISEAQRFTTKLLTDGTKRGNTPPSSIGDHAIR